MPDFILHIIVVIKINLQNTLCKNHWLKYVNKIKENFEVEFKQCSDFWKWMQMSEYFIR